MDLSSFRIHGPATRDAPCNGCKFFSSVQGYFNTCTNPEWTQKTCYYGFPQKVYPQPCWVARTKPPRNINPSNPLGE